MPSEQGFGREQKLVQTLHELLDCAERLAVALEGERRGRTLAQLQADGELPIEIPRARVALAWPP